MLIGKIKWFDEHTGYGFIRPDNPSEDVFFHKSAFQESSRLINQGDEVFFRIDPLERGPEASIIIFGNND